jgi:hypothetical protein
VGLHASTLGRHARHLREAGLLPADGEALGAEHAAVMRVRKRAEQGVIDQHNAARLRRIADEDGGSDPVGARFKRKDADILEAKAAEALALTTYTTSLPRKGNGGELVPLPEIESGTLAGPAATEGAPLQGIFPAVKVSMSRSSDEGKAGLPDARGEGWRPEGRVQRQLSNGALHGRSESGASIRSRSHARSPRSH